MAILLALGVAACGSGTSAEPAPRDAVVLAASKTNDAGTYKADISGTVDAVGQSLQMSGTGEFDAKEQRGSMTMTMSGAGQDIDMQMVMAFPIMYMRFPPGLATGLPAGRSWVKMDLQKLGEQAGLDLGELMQSAQSDPSQSLQYLEGASDIQAVDDEDVRGVATTHYKGYADLTKLADKNPKLKPTIDRLVQQSGVSRIPIEVWVDDQNFVRRIKETISTAGVNTVMTIELYDFGTAVDIHEPPADQVVDFQDLMGSQS